MAQNNQDRVLVTRERNGFYYVTKEHRTKGNTETVERERMSFARIDVAMTWVKRD